MREGASPSKGIGRGRNCKCMAWRHHNLEALLEQKAGRGHTVNGRISATQQGVLASLGDRRWVGLLDSRRMQPRGPAAARAPPRHAPRRRRPRAQCPRRHRPLLPVPSITPATARGKGLKTLQTPKAQRGGAGRWGSRRLPRTERRRETKLSPGPGLTCPVTLGSSSLLWILLHGGTPPRSPSGG